MGMCEIYMRKINVVNINFETKVYDFTNIYNRFHTTVLYVMIARNLFSPKKHIGCHWPAIYTYKYIHKKKQN